MTRYKASALHFLGSVVVLAILFMLINFIWYPGRLFFAAAGAHLLMVLICVDVIIGPMVMLVIFKPHKKYLKFDIFIILICQFAFMLYGTYSIFSSRPVFFAFAENHFYMVRASEIDGKDLKLSNSQFSSLPIWGPVYVGTKEPDDIKTRNDIVFSSLGGMGIQNLPQYFIPFEQVIQQVKAAGRSSQQIMADSENRTKLRNYEINHPDRQVLFIVMTNKLTPMFVVIDARSAQIVDVI